MTFDPTVFRKKRHEGEYLLICAILSRAILDLFGPLVHSTTPDDQDNIRMEALRFLTDDVGAWAARRRELCDFVEINADDMRRVVVRTLEGEDALHAYRDYVTNLDGARRLWAEHKARAARAHSARLEAAARLRERRAREAAIAAQRAKRLEAKRIPPDMDAALLEALKDGPKTIREIGFVIPRDPSVLREALKRLVARGLVIHDSPHYAKSPHSTVAASSFFVAACAG